MSFFCLPIFVAGLQPACALHCHVCSRPHAKARHVCARAIFVDQLASLHILADASDAAAPAHDASARFLELWGDSPFVINRMDVMTDTGIIRSQPVGLTVTPSGWVGILFVILFQVFAPMGIVKYSKRLKEDEQAWLERGVDADQAVIRAYNNQRPPPTDDADQLGTEDGSVNEQHQQEQVVQVEPDSEQP